MTTIEINYTKALANLGLSTDHEITQKELKMNYLRLAKLYHPDTASNELYKDGKKFQEMKEAYDLLNNDINKTNEIIFNINNPTNKKYEYYQEDVNPTFNQFYTYKTPDYKAMDRPNFMFLFISFIIPLFGFILWNNMKKIFPKSSKIYGFTSIVGMLFLIVPYFI